ncbi:hypothetical protein THIOSC15_970002 [uncultured Thiomicrorhabdus sp.]
MNLELADIKDHWFEINCELTNLHIKDNQRGVTDWIPEDIYAACIYGYAKLYICEDGYLIFKMNSDEFVIWFALSTSPNIQVIDEYFGDICEIAEQAQAKTMAFYTTRKGYDKVIDKGSLTGFKFQHSKYVREV